MSLSEQYWIKSSSQISAGFTAISRAMSDSGAARTTLNLLHSMHQDYLPQLIPNNCEKPNDRIVLRPLPSKFIPKTDVLSLAYAKNAMLLLSGDHAIGSSRRYVYSGDDRILFSWYSTLGFGTPLS